MRNLLLLLIGSLCFMPMLTLAQESQPSWSKLSGLQSGQTIQVTNTASKRYTGTFIKVSDTELVLRDASSEQSIQRTDVRSVKVMKSNQRLKHTLIGAGVGAGTGAVIGAAAGSSGGFFGSDRGALAGIGVAVGGIVGAIVGAVLPAHGTTIYKTTSH